MLISAVSDTSTLIFSVQSGFESGKSSHISSLIPSSVDPSTGPSLLKRDTDGQSHIFYRESVSIAAPVKGSFPAMKFWATA